jgi:hypothetical protein
MFAPLVTRTKSRPEPQRRRGLGDTRPRDVAPAAWKLAAGIQAKLTVGTVDDPLEAEADRIADHVLGGPARKTMDDASRQTALERGRKSPGAAPSGLLGGAGQPLKPSLRNFFEPRFGCDFSQVRIFSDEQAANSARSFGALAYTSGPNISFGEGRYRPDLSDGRRLLAHELTHVVQQGHAAPTDGSAAKVTFGRATPSIQRDTPEGQQNIPPGATNQGGPLSITKRYDPVNASRDEVVQALTKYLNKELVVQGGESLAVTERMRWAVLKLLRSDPDGYARLKAHLSKSGLPGSPADFAAMVGKELPDFIPRKDMLHLDAQPVKDPEPKSTVDKAKAGIKEKVSELGKTPEVVGEPNGPVEAPSTTPTMGGSPGQHVISTPGRPWGGSSRPSHRPDLSQVPVASDQEAVQKIVQALDDGSLIPAAAKDTPGAADFGGAKLFAENVARLLAAAQDHGQSTVTVPISINYRQVEDLREIFIRMETIVRQIAGALQGGVSGVDKVIISPPRGKGDKIPPQWIVMLHDRQ